MKSALQPPASMAPKGLSLVEVMVTITVLGVMAGIALIAFGSGHRAAVFDAKLTSDVNTLNSLLALYESDGGSLTGVTTEQQALDRLKRSRPNAEVRVHTLSGSGRFIDIRLRARQGSGALPEGRAARAKWNTTTKRFELGPTGVDEFFLDDSLTEAAFPLDSRAAPRKVFNSSNGWIWANNSAPPFSYVSPTTIPIGGGDDWFNPNDPIPTSATTTTTTTTSSPATSSPATTGPTASQLPTPTFNPSGGSFAFASFPGSVTISGNGAPPGQSDLKYRINGGAWQTYTGSAISINSGDRIQAQNVTTNPTNWSDSGVRSGDYYRLVSDFTGSGTGSWTNVTGGSNLVHTITNSNPTSSLSHGNTQLDLGNGEFLDAGVENLLTYTKSNFNTVAPNVPFKLGDLVMLNGTTFYNSEATGARLDLALTFSSPPVTTTASLNLAFTNTPNSTDRLASADIVEITNSSNVATVTIDNVTYTLRVEWVTLDPSAGVVSGNKFLTFEGSTARAELRATLVSNH